MRRLVISLFTAALAVSLVAATPGPEAGWTTVAQENCVAGPDLDDGLASDWEDMCSVSWRTVASGDGVPTTVAIRMTAVGSVEDREATLYRSEWAVGDCAVMVEHRDGDDLAQGGDVLHAGCGLIRRTCDVAGDGETGVGCYSIYELELERPIDAPVFDGNTVTWTVTFDGGLEDLAEVHRAGSIVEPGHSYAGEAPVVETGRVAPVPGVPGASVTLGGPRTPWVCVLGVCSSPLDERITADRTFTIG